MNKLSSLAGLAAGLLAAAIPSAAAPFNPKPLSDDLVLPMPDGGGMVFRPVLIGGGGGPFACRQFTIGDRTGGFKEYPTPVVLGGALPVTNAVGRADWAYYVGKYEVTERQYRAILSPGETNNVSDLPVVNVSWYDAQDFIRRYLVWLMKEAPDRVPCCGELPAYLRLPTEAEWEFAARGGAAVDADRFDRRHPYDGVLSRYEWYSGPASSHDKIKKAGVLLPNPLGLHDMLGNVAEMTESLYRIEYYQGRTGGFVARGGSFRSPEANLRSSLRSEQPFFNARREPVRQDELGFRLVLVAPLYTSRAAIKDFEAAWNAYRQTRPTPTTAANALNPTAAQTSFQLSDALQALDRLDTELKKTQGVSADAFNHLGLLKASFGNVESLILKAEADSASAWAKIAAYTGWFLARELKKVPASEKVMDLTKQAGGGEAELEVYRQRHAQLLDNIKGASAQYGTTLGELAKLDPAVVRQGFAQYEQHLIDLGAAEQIKANRLVLKQYEEFQQTRRLDMEKWKQELEKL